MPLQEFSVISPNIQPGQIFKAISTALPTDIIERVIDQTGSREQRSRLLPTHLVICLIIALSFWSQDSAKNPKEVFLLLLSDARNNTERSTKLYEEFSKLAENPDVKEALEAREFISKKDLEALDRIFEIIGERPVKLSGRLHDVFVEDFKKELAEIQSPAARHLFILAKANHLAHLRSAEYEILIAASDLTGHFAVGVLLESVLSDKLAFQERTRRLIRHIIEGKVAERVFAHA
jgi:ferritin-like metal-binding protein YciE